MMASPRYQDRWRRLNGDGTDAERNIIADGTETRTLPSERRILSPLEPA